VLIELTEYGVSPVADSCEHDNKPLVFIKAEDSTDKLSLAYQKELFSIESLKMYSQEIFLNISL
jgi:hypothetical protein